MRRPQYAPVRQIVRIKPGGLIRLSPKFIKWTGWKVGNTLHLSVEGGRIFVGRIREEREWRITRLRLRTGATLLRNASPKLIRTLGEHPAPHSGRTNPNGQNRDPGTPRRPNTVVPHCVQLHPTREEVQDRWRALEEETDRLFDNLSAYLECEHPDLVQEITETLGDDVAALHIARLIRRDLFMERGDAWRKDVKRRIMSAAFGICA